MVYTGYTKEEYDSLPKKYQKKVVGISDCNNIMQIPLCPLCSGPMMIRTDMIGYISCTDCGEIRKLRILK